MESKKFAQIVERRLGRVAQRIERVIKNRKVPPQLAREIREDFAKGAGQIRQAAQKAGADGQVTREEAREVRDLARELREQAIDKYRDKIRAAREGRGNRNGRQ